MNSEKLHDALNLIDDELIEETNRRRQKKPVNKHVVLRALAYTAAACFYIFVIVAVLFFIKGTRRHYNAGLMDGDSFGDKNILAVTDGIDKGKEPSITQHPTRKPLATLLTSEVPDATLGEPDCTGIPDGGLPPRSPQKTPNATSVPKETSSSEDEVKDESDLPIDATELPQEPTYSLKYVIVEVLSLNNGRFDCIGAGNDEFSEIKDGENVEIIADNDDVASGMSYYVGARVKVYFSQYDYYGRIVAEGIVEVD